MSKFGGWFDVQISRTRPWKRRWHHGQTQHPLWSALGVLPRPGSSREPLGSSRTFKRQKLSRKMSARSDVIIYPGVTSARRLECQVHFSACQEPVAVPGVCTCVGFRELCILAATAATFHSDVLHPFNICVFMWTSWLRSLRLPALWHRLIRFSTAESCSSMLIQPPLTWGYESAASTWRTPTQQLYTRAVLDNLSDIPPKSQANSLLMVLSHSLLSPPCGRGWLPPVPPRVKWRFLFELSLLICNNIEDYACLPLEMSTSISKMSAFGWPWRVHTKYSFEFLSGSKF